MRRIVLVLGLVILTFPLRVSGETHVPSVNIPVPLAGGGALPIVPDAVAADLKSFSDLPTDFTDHGADALDYLRDSMDRYLHFGLYADNFSVGNHFVPTGWSGDATTTGVLSFDPSHSESWHSGGNCIRISYSGGGSQGWAAIFWQHPGNNWGTEPDGGFDLSGAKALTFWARGEHGGEKVEFKVGGVGGATRAEFGDTVEVTLEVVEMDSDWRKYTIGLEGKDLSRVVSGFVLVLSRYENPDGATFYLDDIRYEGLESKLRLIESYTSLTDFVPPRPMDTHRYLYVYSDYEATTNSFFNNGFYESGWMGDWADIGVDMNETEIRHSGTSSMRWEYSGTRTQQQGWAGVYWQAPFGFWGDRVGGYDLTGASHVSFWAKGASGGEKLTFLLGGITGPFHDSLQPARKLEVTLTGEWTQYAIDLTDADLSRIGGGFGWTIEQEENPDGATFYLDEIVYVNSSPSIEGIYQIDHETFPPDSHSMMAAHIYDNALALLAFLSTGDPDDADRARLLADSFVWVQKHDAFRDGRIRNVYYPDDLKTGTTYGNDGKTPRNNYDKYGNGAGPGNMGWVMIALLNYYKFHGGDSYLESALSMGEWIHENCRVLEGIGYTAGYNGWPPSNMDILRYKSTEHNIDVYVAFMLLYELTGNAVWRERALDAKAFVRSMWDEESALFFTGTSEDGVTPNRDNFPVDVMPWGLLALGEMETYGPGLDTAVTSHSTSVVIDDLVFEGVDFNHDKDGIWLEGTAQLVTAYWPVSHFGTNAMRTDATINAIKYLGELRKAQKRAPRNDGKGIVATVSERITTGFDLPTGGEWYYHNRLHVGATAWFVFAERKWNPYWAIPADHPIPYQYDTKASCVWVLH